MVDDCSTDDTEKIVKEFQKEYINLRYYRHDKNQGLAAARNTGASLAKGEYIAFLDDDDQLAPNFLGVTSALLDNLPQVKIVVGQRIIIYPEGVKFQFSPTISEKTLYTTLDDGYLVRREVFSEIKYDEELLTNEDADFGIQFMQKYGHKVFCVLHTPLLLKYGHKIGAVESWSSASERTYRGMELYLKKNLPTYYRHGDKNEIEYILRMMGRLYCQGGKMTQGLGYLWRAMREKPMAKNIILILFALGGKSFFNWCYTKYATTARHL